MVGKAHHELLNLVLLPDKDKYLVTQLEELIAAIKDGEDQGYRIQEWSTSDDGNLRVQMWRNDVGKAEASIKLNKSIDDLEVSVRAFNCLKNIGIRTIRDLVVMTEDQLLLKRQFGPKSTNEIKEVLASMNLSLGMKLDC